MGDISSGPGADDIARMVIADMEERRRVGMAEYGKPVAALDPEEDWLQHGYEEALDLAVYLKAEIERRRLKRLSG